MMALPALAGAWRRKRQALSNRTLFAFTVTGGLGGSATFTRTGTATFTQDVSDTVVAYAVGGSLAGATFTRTGTATYTGDI